MHPPLHEGVLSVYGRPTWRFLVATTLLGIVLGLFGCAVNPPYSYPPPAPAYPYPGYWDAWPEYRFGFGWQWGHGHGWDHHWHDRGGHGVHDGGHGGGGGPAGGGRSGGGGRGGHR